MKTNVDLHLLRCFEALLSEQNVSRAARKMDLTQSSMSHALSRLRELFEDPLFVKSHGAMVPTVRAKTLAPQLRDVLSGADALLTTAAPFDPKEAQLEFHVMAAENVEYLLLPVLLRQLQRKAPRVRVLFESADRARAFERLERGDVDFRLAWWTEPAQTLHSKHLFSDPFVCIARVGHPDVDGTISEANFLEMPHAVIQPARSGLAYEAVANAFARRNRPLDAALQVQNSVCLCNAVAGSDLIATLPERFARALQRQFQIQVVNVPLTVAHARQAIYWHERTHKLPSHRWFRNLICEVAATL